MKYFRTDECPFRKRFVHDVNRWVRLGQHSPLENCEQSGCICELFTSRYKKHDSQDLLSVATLSRLMNHCASSNSALWKQTHQSKFIAVDTWHHMAPVQPRTSSNGTIKQTRKKMGYDEEETNSMRRLLSVFTFRKWSRKVRYGYEYYYRFNHLKIIMYFIYRALSNHYFYLLSQQVSGVWL